MCWNDGMVTQGERARELNFLSESEIGKWE